MRVGLSDAGIAPPVFLRAGQALALAGGAKSFWLPDHLINLLPRALWKPAHVGTARLVPRLDAFLEPNTALGYMAARTRWSRLHLGVSVTDAGRRHPAVTAQAFATLHLLSRGRAILGIGTGERENNEPYGVDWSAPVARFEEALGVIRALWDSDGAPVTRAGRFFPLRDAVFDLPPHRGTRPPIFVAAHGPRMLRLVGRYADGWLPAWPQTSKLYGERLTAAREAASDAGRDPHAIVGAGWFFVMTGPTRSAVEEILDAPLARAFALNLPADEWAAFGVEHPLGPSFTGTQDLLPHLLDEATALEYARRVPEGLLAHGYFAGTPSELAERFAEYRDQGLSYPVLLNASIFFHLRKGAPAAASMVALMRTLRRM